MRLLERLQEALDEVDYQDEDTYLDELHELIFNLLESLDYEGLDEEQQEQVDNLVEMVDDDYYEQWYEDDELEESRIQRVVRGGQLKKRLKPKKGYKVQNGKYVKISAQEKVKRSKGAKRAARKRRTQKGAIQRSRKKSMLKRKSRGM